MTRAERRRRRRLDALVVVVLSVVGAISAFVPTAYDSGEVDSPLTSPIAGERQRKVRVPPTPRSRTLGTDPSDAPEGTHTLEGRVDFDGKPVPGARVTLTFTGDPSALHHLDCDEHRIAGRKLLECGCTVADTRLAGLVGLRAGEAPPVDEVTSGIDGRFRFEGLGAAEYAVWAATKDSIVVTTARLPSNGAHPLVVTLEPGRFISGRTVDAGRPVAFARITSIPISHARFFDGTSDALGEFRIGPLPSGPHVFVAFAEGHLPGVAGTVDGPVELELARAASVAGLVTLEGKPVAGARVRMIGRHRVPSTLTDDKGAFEIRAVPPSDYVIEAESGDAFAHAEVSPRSGAAESLTLALETIGGVDVTLVPVDGATVSDAVVTLVPTRVEVGNELADRERWLVETATGQFTGRGVSAGSYRIGVSGPALARSWTIVQVGDAIVPVRIEVKPAAVLEGVVVDENGMPIEGVRLTPSEENPGSDATSGADGRFSIAELEPGRVTLRVEPVDHLRPEAPLVFEAPSRDARIVLSGGLTVTWVVTEFDGRAADGVWVKVQGATAEEDRARSASGAGSPDGPVSRECLVDATGRCSTRGLRPGSYVASAALETRIQFGRLLDVDGGYRRLSRLAPPRTVQLSPGGPREFTLRLPRSEDITGRVVRGDGTGAENAALHVTVKGPELRVESKTCDADGRFRVTRVAPGAAVDLLATAKDGGKAEAQAVKAGTRDLQLLLTAGRRWTGRIVDEDKRPIPTARIAGVPVKADGRFEVDESMLRGSPAIITAPGFAAQHLPERLEAPANAELGDITLHPLARYSGIVVDALDARPIRDATVRTGSRSIATTTRADGTFVLEAPRVPGTILLVEAAGHAGASIQTGSDVENLRVELTTGSPLTIEWEEGEDPGELSVLLLRDGDLLPRTETGNSPLLIEHVAPGHYDLGAGRWQSLSIPLGSGLDGLKTNGVITFAGEVTVAQGVPAHVTLGRNPAIRDVTVAITPSWPMERVLLLRGRFDADATVASIVVSGVEPRIGAGTPPRFHDVAAGPQTLVACDERQCWRATFEVPRGTTPFSTTVALKGAGEPME